MDTSLFEVLSAAHSGAVVTLSTQFRMNKDITALANVLVYKGQLTCGSPDTEARRLHAPRFPAGAPAGSWLARACDPAHSVVFLDTDAVLPGGARESRVAAGWASPELGAAPASFALDSASLVVNEIEALIAHVIVDRLSRCGAALADVGVISPYRAQLRVLRRRIVDIVEVQTVDTFQGRDKACILISLVRSNPDLAVGSLLLDWRRLNVAFTRAKCKLVVIGSRATLSQSPVCQKFLLLCDEQGWVEKLPPNGHCMFGDPGCRKAG
jgi:DNA replication ATP-dependent helicase Dna2